MSMKNVKTNAVGDAMIARMISDGGYCWSVCVMDGMMNDVYFDVEPPLKLWKGMGPHPLNRATVAASYLGRDGRFDIKRFRGCDSNGRDRILRLYVLKEEYR